MKLKLSRSFQQEHRRISVKIRDFLDFFVTNGINSAYTAVVPSYNMTSGHSPIIATIGDSYLNNPPNDYTIRGQIRKNSGKRKFSYNINEPEEIVTAMQTLTLLLQ